jgi:hypothetical protein
VCCDPLLLNQSALVMTETLAAALTLAAVAALIAWSDRKTWHWAAAAGALLALCVLCRPTYLPWLGLVVIVALARPRLLSLSMPWRQALILAGVALLVVLPWTIRNMLVFGRPIVTTTHGDYTLLLGNNPYFYRYLHEQWWSEAWQADEFDAQWALRRQVVDSPGTELADEAAAYAWASETIRSSPTDFALAAVHRWWQLLSPLPSRVEGSESWQRAAARYTVAAWYVGVYLLVLGGLRNRQEERQAFFVWSALLVGAFFAVHTFYWANLRMRTPLMPLVCLVAGMGVERWLGKRRASQSND